MQTRDQKYATIAYNQVYTIKDKEGCEKYGAMAHKLPILIHTAGLAQALAFVNSRDKEIQKQLLSDLKAAIEPDDPRTLLAHVQNADLNEYIRLTRYVLDALLWYKRFAQSILGVEAGEDEEDGGKND